MNWLGLFSHRRPMLRLSACLILGQQPVIRSSAAASILSISRHMTRTGRRRTTVGNPTVDMAPSFRV